MRTLRSSLRSCVFLLGLLVALGGAWGQSFPDKSRVLRILTPNGVGTSPDLLARALARSMTELYELSVIVENRPGAEGVIGMREARNAAPDGYTVLLTSSSAVVLNPHMIADLGYDMLADFVPLATLTMQNQLMLVGPSTSFKTAREFIAAARANPGKYTFGSGSTTTRLAGEQLQQRAGIQLLNVPFKSGNEGRAALLGGQIDLFISDAAGAGAAYTSGRLRALAATGVARSKYEQHIPTLREEGVPDYELYAWTATYAPAKTPPEIAAKLREMIRNAAKTPQMTSMLAGSAIESLDLAGDQLMEFQRTEIRKWGDMVRAANMGLFKK